MYIIESNNKLGITMNGILTLDHKEIMKDGQTASCLVEK